MDEISFKNNELQLTGKYLSDVAPYETKFSVKGKYYSDSLCVHLLDMNENSNNDDFIPCSGKDVNNKRSWTVLYKFKGDTLLFSIYEKKEDLEINTGCFPTHYFLKSKQ